MLLVAFALNSYGLIDARSRSYHAINALGAGLSCAASLMIEYMPFVVLEAAWLLVALVAIARHQPPRR
ncbi:MAG TPA: hypothetical protein ENK18_26140 [Deltaproteobacteria bacterium]|nr:hypothetical protein [Deltaproteobacteria bacterium]